MQASKYTIQRISAAQTRPLRQKILRPHQTVEAQVWPGDGVESTIHVGAFLGGELVGVATLVIEGRRGRPNPEKNEWRLRGMAVRQDHQGLGAGRLLVQECIQQLRTQKAKLFWCNARESAWRFYEKLGFKVTSELFDIPEVGPHYVMELDL